MISKLIRLLRFQRGASLAEYMLLVALIAVVCLVAVGAFGGHLHAAYETIRAAIAKPVATFAGG